jgi:hypothetical protein
VVVADLQVKRVRLRLVGPEVPKHKKLEFLNGFFQVCPVLFIFLKNI